MIVRGLDFTSNPRTSKPITCAETRLDGSSLCVIGLREFVDFDSFTDYLASLGPWIVGLDFPFGQARKLICNLGWSEDWERYVRHVADLGKDGFVGLLNRYKHSRPYGDREHHRLTDEIAGSISPQKLYGVPVGKMFFEGATRLLDLPASIIPVRPRDDTRIVVEAYPALVVRNLLGKKQAYKHDAKPKQTDERRQVRERIVAFLKGERVANAYGFSVIFGMEDERRLVEDATGDRLDALLCAIQAAWSYAERDRNFGVPENADRLEGWIVDPKLLAAGSHRSAMA